PHSCAPGNNFPVGHPSPNCSGPSTLNLGVLWRPASGKEVATCCYEYSINPIKPWAGVSHTHPLKRPTSSSVNPKPGTSSLGHVPYVQCRQPMCHVRASSANGPCATSVRPVPTVHPRCPCTCRWHLRPHAPVLMPPHLRPYVPVKPRELALIPFCNVPPPRGRARLHLAAF